jgi:transposase
VRSVAARVAALIRVDSVWLATEPIDMRAGTETALARVVKVFGSAHTHHAYLFATRRASSCTMASGSGCAHVG